MIRQEAMLKRIRIQRQEIGRLNDMIKHRDDKERKRNHRHKEMLKEGIKIERKRLKQSLAKELNNRIKLNKKLSKISLEVRDTHGYPSPEWDYNNKKYVQAEAKLEALEELKHRLGLSEDLK